MVKKMRNEKGFTLVELIAVIVILGILAAVAVPKFMDMQGEARIAATSGALAAAAGNVTLRYSKMLAGGLTATMASLESSLNTNDTNLGGDYTAAYSSTTGGIKITISAANTGVTTAGTNTKAIILE